MRPETHDLVLQWPSCPSDTLNSGKVNSSEFSFLTAQTHDGFHHFKKATPTGQLVAFSCKSVREVHLASLNSATVLWLEPLQHCDVWRSPQGSDTPETSHTMLLIAHFLDVFCRSLNFIHNCGTIVTLWQLREHEGFWQTWSTCKNPTLYS